jgi:hypothetical protein
MPATEFVELDESLPLRLQAATVSATAAMAAVDNKFRVVIVFYNPFIRAVSFLCSAVEFE